jgi:hypothetical protein
MKKDLNQNPTEQNAQREPAYWHSAAANDAIPIPTVKKNKKLLTLFTFVKS